MPLDSPLLSAVLSMAGLFIVFLVHELGHLGVARLFGVHVAQISFGIGRPVWQRVDRHSTCWQIGVLPFGGFVQLTNPRATPKGDFALRPLWQRACIVAAGPIANLFLAAAILILFFFTIGRPYIPPVVTGVEVGGSADRQGVKVGDIILAVDGVRVTQFEDVIDAMKTIDLRPYSVSILRGGQRIDIAVDPWRTRYVDTRNVYRDHMRIGLTAQHLPLLLSAVTTIDGLAMPSEDATRAALLERLGRPINIGLKSLDGMVHTYRTVLPADENSGLSDRGSPDYDLVYFSSFGGNPYRSQSFGQAVWEGMKATGALVGGVASIVTSPWPIDYQRLGPPVNPFGKRYVLAMLYHYLYKAALLSVAIALINLLPIPGLDGYMLLRYALQCVGGQKRADRWHPYFWRGIVLLVAACLMANNLASLRSHDIDPNLPAATRPAP